MRLLLSLIILGFSIQASAARCDFKKNGLGDYRVFAKYLKSLKSVKTADQLGPYTNFPVKLNVGSKKYIIKNTAQLKKHTKLIMSKRLRGAIQKAKIRFVYCDGQGVMLGKGNVWIQLKKNKYKIIALNP